MKNFLKEQLDKIFELGTNIFNEAYSMEQELEKALPDNVKNRKLLFDLFFKTTAPILEINNCLKGIFKAYCTTPKATEQFNMQDNDFLSNVKCCWNCNKWAANEYGISSSHIEDELMACSAQNQHNILTNYKFCCENYEGTATQENLLQYTDVPERYSQQIPYKELQERLTTKGKNK